MQRRTSGSRISARSAKSSGRSPRRNANTPPFITPKSNKFLASRRFPCEINVLDLSRKIEVSLSFKYGEIRKRNELAGPIIAYHGILLGVVSDHYGVQINHDP